MKISVISSSKSNFIASKNDFDNFSGKIAGICYMVNDFDSLINEPEEKTTRRILQTKQSGHHSVYDHNYITLYFNNVPKIIAMILNNEKMYTTSEKSARYTKMNLTSNEQSLYDKWLKIFETLIKKIYFIKYAKFFTEKKIEKLAQENARYLTSIFTPTSFAYTISYRQLNIIYAMCLEYIRNNKDYYGGLLINKLKEFCDELKSSVPYLDEDLIKNEKNRKLALFGNISHFEEYFGNVYCTKYKCSYACLAQAMRHRTLSYTFKPLKTPEFYIPEILKSDKSLVEDWISDCNKLKDSFPQGMLINVYEMGTMDNFILKMKERKCTFALLEINKTTDNTLKKFCNALRKNKSKNYEYLKKYSLGSRCTFPDYKCNFPCGFAEGVKGTRII